MACKKDMCGICFLFLYFVFNELTMYPLYQMLMLMSIVFNVFTRLQPVEAWRLFYNKPSFVLTSESFLIAICSALDEPSSMTCSSLGLSS